MPVLAINKRARFDYEILDHYEAGLVLTGAETKSAKKGHIQMKGSYVTFHGTVPSIINMHISPYAKAGVQPGYNPTRSRLLLLNKRQITHLLGKKKEQGLSLIPLRVYTKNNRVKVEFGIGRGKKQQDKRETIKKREQNRDMRRNYGV
jgi:SsrA-binding protein